MASFSKFVAQKRLLIPLAHLPHKDFLSWRGEASGEYTVHSRYKILLKAMLTIIITTQVRLLNATKNFRIVTFLQKLLL